LPGRKRILERGRARWLTLLPLGLIAAGLVLVPLAAVVELPGESRVKDALGIDSGCGTIRDRGSFADWQKESPLRTLVDEPGMVRVGTSVYLVGGIRSVDGPVAKSASTFERYDIRSGKVSSLPPLPARLNHVGVAHRRGDIYVVGGIGDRLNPVETTNRAWRYGIAERRWEELPPMPTQRGALGLGVIRDSLYAVGGLNDSGPISDLEIYDIRARRWSRGEPMPTAREHFGLAVEGGRLYAVAGRRPGGIVYGDFERYDPESERWTRLADYPNPISGLRLVPLSGRLVASGGEHPGDRAVSGQVLAFDPRRGEWSRLPFMPVPKHGHGSVGFDGRLYVLGGSTCVGFKPRLTVESLRIPPS
jgi:hypothetical protein